jgi:Flp pilus assembly protein TadG
VTSWRGDRGSVSAEFAVALPAAILVLALGVGALGAAGRQVRLQDAAADAARLLARGEDTGRAQSAVGTAVPGASMAVEHRGDLVCVTASATVRVGIAVTLTGSACALDGGR